MSARTCMQVRTDLSAYLDGDLDAGLADATRVHLDGCSACRSELSLLRLTVDTLHRLPDLPPPAAILTGVRARLRPEPWHRRLLGGGLWHFSFPLSAAATVLVLFGVSLFLARYPDMPKTVSRDSSPQSPAPAVPESPLPPALQLQARPAHVAPPAPAARDKGGDRQAAPPTAPAVRGDLHAKRAPGPALVQPAQPGPLVEPPKGAFREEPRRADNVAAAPPRDVVLQPEPAAERSVAVSDYAAKQSAQARTAPPARDAAAFGNLGERAVSSSSSLEKKKEAPASFAEKTDSGASLGQARIAGEKVTAPRWTQVVCLLPPDGDTVDDFEKVLRREGAGEITISELEPPAVRAALAPHRGRLGSLPGPSRGWTVTASFPPGEYPRLLDALARRPGLRILEQPATPTEPEDLPERLGLRITVLR